MKSKKVIVTRSEDEITTLHDLYERSLKNGAKVDLIDEKQLSEIEPNARTVGQALYSHYTAVVDPKQVLASLKDDLITSGKVTIIFDCAVTGLSGSKSDGGNVHILNPVSPAFTSSMDLAQTVVREYFRP